MGPKVIKNSEDKHSTEEPIKAKRGRKSKKELMASLNMQPIISNKDTNINPNVDTNLDNQTIINLTINEITNPIETQNNYQNVFVEQETQENEETENNQIVIVSNSSSNDEEKPIIKKRGRKPKGGKIVQQVVPNEPVQEDKPNIILHLKCSMKDLLIPNQNTSFIESYNFHAAKNDLTYEIIANENINTFNDKTNTSISNLDNEYDYDNDDDSICKDVNKEIWKKLKQLEHNLHINNVNNKRSACFWDTCEFDNPPIYIPKHFINDTYHVYGCFCSPECGVAYLMNENIDSSTKFERYHLFNHIYSKIYDYKKNIKPAPNPFYMLEKYYGNLSIQEYRSLLRNERLFLIVDKPLTRILPELHEDNDDFILNNKIIPSNNYHVKTKLQRKKQNKTSILNEKFGIVNQAILE
jgi:hypothetical protein